MSVWAWTLGTIFYLVIAKIVYSYCMWTDVCSGANAGIAILPALFWPIPLTAICVMLFFSHEYVIEGYKSFNRERERNKRQHKFDKMEKLRQEIEEIKKNV